MPVLRHVKASKKSLVYSKILVFTSIVNIALLGYLIWLLN